MAEPDLDAPLSRTAASAAVVGIGWRYLLGELAVSVPVRSLAQASVVAAAAVAAGGHDADGHLRVDLRPDRVELSVQDAERRRGDRARHGAGGAHHRGRGRPRARPGRCVTAESPRPVQALEMAIDAIDIPAIRPFWKAVLGYVDEPGEAGRSSRSSIRPGSCPGSGSSRWTRPGRSATGCTSTSLSRTTRPSPGCAPPLPAGGRLVDDSHARAFWVLADAEGNEACVCTWTDRDEPEQ